MALRKKIRQRNGIETNYHRIAMVKIETNQQTTILLKSYLNEESRNYEKSINGKDFNMPYVADEYLSFGYDEKMNVSNAYNLLKTHPDFMDAEDV